AAPSGVQHGFGDLPAGQPVAQAATDVPAQFTGGPQRDEHANIQQAAIPLLQAGPAPDGTPDGRGEVLLQLLAVLTRVALQRGVHASTAHHRTPHLAPRVLTGTAAPLR